MRINRFLLVSVGCASLVLLGIALGIWQMARADYKISLRQAVDAASALEPLRNSDFQARLPEVGDMHRRVQLRGQWLVDQTIYWDNIPMADRAGLVVLTPLKLADQTGVVLVQRGWIARNFQDRTQLHPIETPTGEVTVEGLVSHWPSQRISLGGTEQGHIRQNPQLAEYRTLLGAQVASVTIRQTGPASEGMLREWSRPDDGVNMHKGYAFQWFSLSALVAAYYFWFQIVKRKQQT
jgi:surfeit locus 1 family protein